MLTKIVEFIYIRLENIIVYYVSHLSVLMVTFLIVFTCCNSGYGLACRDLRALGGLAGQRRTSSAAIQSRHQDNGWKGFWLLECGRCCKPKRRLQARNVEANGTFPLSPVGGVTGRFQLHLLQYCRLRRHGEPEKLLKGNI